IYGVDTVLTIIHRLILKENIFVAHRKHLYQLMSNELHIPHIWVSIIYMFVQSVVMVGYFSLKSNSIFYLFGSLALMVLIYIAFMQKYFKLHKKNVPDPY
ncbi:MAG: UDP-GlcNAc--UDP-phosphate GlcNAc-1-phosphate transferase, partial [Bacteroidales bacterium]